jgi:GH24 family phage-related lysozyme (muramidase)
MTYKEEIYSILRRFEGLKLYVYKDDRGFKTVGIGSLVSGLPAPFNALELGQPITLQQANDWMWNELESKGINKYVNSHGWSQNKAVACASFFYHHGFSLPDTKQIMEKQASYWLFQSWIFKMFDNNDIKLKERNYRTFHYGQTGELLAPLSYNNTAIAIANGVKSGIVPPPGEVKKKLI